jgi:hypothetical protein
MLSATKHKILDYNLIKYGTYKLTQLAQYAGTLAEAHAGPKRGPLKILSLRKPLITYRLFYVDRDSLYFCSMQRTLVRR